MAEVQVKKEEGKKKDKFKGMVVSYIRKNRGGHFSKSHKKGDTPLIEPNRMKKGMMIAMPIDDDKVRIGWSLCNFAMGDKFGDLGVSIAIDRAANGSRLVPAASMIKPLEKFIDRARRYYKDRKVHITFPKSVKYDKDGNMVNTTAF